MRICFSSVSSLKPGVSLWDACWPGQGVESCDKISFVNQSKHKKNKIPLLILMLQKIIVKEMDLSLETSKLASHQHHSDLFHVRAYRNGDF